MGHLQDEDGDATEASLASDAVAKPKPKAVKAKAETKSERVQRE
jgi:hypothetical protein